MKKMLAAVGFGMASGAIGSYFVYNQYKNGNIKKLVNKASDAAKDTVNKMK